MFDVVLFAALLLSFATLVTSHVVLAFRLVGVRPRWRGLVALVIPPLAPLWGYREGFRRTSTLWLAALVVYVATLAAAG